MQKAFRVAVSSVAILFGSASLLLVTLIRIRLGWPEGLKPFFYLWFLTLTGPLPLSIGVNLGWGLVRWRSFAGWWLIALAATHIAGVLLIAHALKSYRLDFTLLGAIGIPFLAFLLGGLLILLIRGTRPTASDTDMLE